MNQPLVIAGAVALLLAVYNAIRAGILLFRAIRRLASSRDFVRLSQHNPPAALMIFMQAPGRERGFMRYSLVGMFFFVTALFVLNKALPPHP